MCIICYFAFEIKSENRCDTINIIKKEITISQGKTKTKPTNGVQGYFKFGIAFLSLGQLFGECKQVYHYGLRDYFRSYYNIMDWVSVSLYLGAFALRIFVDLRVQATQKVFQHQLLYAQALLQNASSVIVNNEASIFDIKIGTDQQNNYVSYRNRLLSTDTAYWLRGCRFEAIL